MKEQTAGIGVPESPIFPKDATDRNRTSPFAFTGNKFEFRMMGSQANISDANICLNTITADTFEKFADELEGSKDLEKDANALIKRELKAHHRIIFNMDGYGPDWEGEAEKRGLLNKKNTADAVPVLYEKENIDVYVRQGVYTEAEAIARADVALENYSKTVAIEAKTMIEMARRDYIPAVSDYLADLSQNLITKKEACEGAACKTESDLIATLSDLNDKASEAVAELEKAMADATMPGERELSQHMAHVVVPDMEKLRYFVDEMEKLTSADYWPYDSYFEVIYSV